MDIPSRHSNPFATCWTCPTSLAFQFPPGQSAEQLVARLAAANWLGEIVGPHGSGKSTLLETLKPHLVAAGRNVVSIVLRVGQRRLPDSWLRSALASSRPLVIVDGYEQLGGLNRLLLPWRCRRATAGLLVTSHTSTQLPRLIQLQPDLALAQQLVTTLTRRIPSPITPAQVDASHSCHGSNLRELFFDLHSQHEQLRHDTRTSHASPA